MVEVIRNLDSEQILACLCCFTFTAVNKSPYFFLILHLLLTRAPDGSCILTNSADNVLRVYNLPPEIYSYNWDMLPEMVNKDIFTMFVHNIDQVASSGMEMAATRRTQSTVKTSEVQSLRTGNSIKGPANNYILLL